MAFVVPAEIGHAPYAAPLIWYLTGNFRRVQIVALLRKLFPQLSEDAWLLFADGYRESTEDLLVTKLEQFEFLEEPPAEGTEVTLSEWQRWGCRLRPFLLQSGVRGLYEELAVHLQTSRLGAVARASVGYVTGANEFFHLRPSAAREAGIPERFLCPTVRNARCLPPNVLTKETVECWLRRDDPVLLLRLSSHEKPPRAVQEYLDSPAGREARESYKCRNRHPWYAVPDVTFPDAFLSYMSGEGPSLVANVARCACTNSLHAVQMKNGASVSDLQASWSHPLTRLSCELEGHPLGGGMLKLEPREAARLVIPRRDLALTRRELRCIEEGIAELRRWRHYE